MKMHMPVRFLEVIVTKNLKLLFFIAILHLLSACSERSDPTEYKITYDDREESICSGSRTDPRSEVIPPLTKPEPLKPYVDPVFGSRIIRVSDAKFGEVVKPTYSTIQSWNANESLMILYHTGGESIGHYLYDGITYRSLKKLDIVTNNIEEVFWHHSDPNTFFYISALPSQYGYLMKYTVSTDTEIELENFSGICGDGLIMTSGNNIMMQSVDDDHFGFRCDLHEPDIAISYQISTGKTSQLFIGEKSGYEPSLYAPLPAPSGDKYLLNEWVVSSDLQKRLTQLDLHDFESPSSLGQLSNGNDALFATGFATSPKGCSGATNKGVGTLIVHDLDDGSCRAVISESTGYGMPLSGTHISAVAHQNSSGWVALSSIGYGHLSYLSNTNPAPVLLSEIYLAGTEPKDAVVCRLAHHRSHGRNSKNGGYFGYFGEPHATISPSGTRVLFGSDWHDSGSVDSYVVELPGYAGSALRAKP